MATNDNGRDGRSTDLRRSNMHGDSYQRLQRLRQEPITHFATGTATACGDPDPQEWATVMALVTCEPCRKAADREALDEWDRVGRVTQGGGPAYLDATDVCEFCANGEHEIGRGDGCGCRCHGQQPSPPCPVCASPATHKPSHDGSARCQSGSPASGGWNAHCSCSVCW